MKTQVGSSCCGFWHRMTFFCAVKHKFLFSFWRNFFNHDFTQLKSEGMNHVTLKVFRVQQNKYPSIATVCSVSTANLSCCSKHVQTCNTGPFTQDREACVMQTVTCGTLQTISQGVHNKLNNNSIIKLDKSCTVTVMWALKLIAKVKIAIPDL